MNPGLAIKLRPTGPWRIGPDSGARNRVDSVYHSDSLYSAITAAMARLGSIEEWLDATARSATPAVSFSSCFPFLDEIGFVVPPRTIWPPESPALLSARVRWKSARFVPLGIVQAILAGHTLNDRDWTVDGPSECLVPAGRPGPFRTAVRWSAAVDRLTGATERHSTACIEFRTGAGLWTVASFADDVAQHRWKEPVKAAFRLLADSGFGGERSRGWGRSDTPEFVDGMLPDLILGVGGRGLGVGDEGAGGQGSGAGDVAQVETEAPVVQPQSESSEPVPAEAFSEGEYSPESLSLTPGPRPPAPDLAPGPQPPAPNPHWLLSLFTPADTDSVDWKRGNYSLLARGGRVESPTGSGELKKQVRMVTEGSVIYAASAPRGAASNVAPDGFAHPVFRAGFALSIPLPEVR